ncbi:fumarate reductase flavoprotein subunit [Rhizobium sp. RU35A]|uniref:FAD-dependent oxidoreductase n=1 Tax=Rhizobium sp. RU35A TaxID=1907414 RepID=UPI000953EE05|nr:FAD-dependent oxidoreductase [Rhizobium sp. RU35A]SIQ95631.1 fumarate reductase flavoprotein subunit [Rhizobium sp. RU35A]
MSRCVRVAEKSFDYRVPLVVIGAGAAGLVAALSAHEAGEEVLVLERDPLPRGSTALSAGLIPAAGTRWQGAAGIFDTPELFAGDIFRKAHGEPDALIVDHVTRLAGPTLEWLADRHGLNFSVIEDFSYPGHSSRRMHGLASRSGEELIDALRAAAEACDIPVVCDAHVTTLFADDAERVLGLAFVRPDASVEEIGCDRLILACNGYGGNRALVATHIPSLSEATYFGHAGNQGDALLWGEALGAATRHLNGHQGHGSVAHPAGILISWATITEGGFQVNIEGRRFSNEAQGYSEQAAEVLKQPEGLAWSIFDRRIAAVTRQFEDYRRAEAMGAIVTAETLADLAARLAVSEEVLLQTFEQVETCRRGETADPFGRDFANSQPLAAPYCAARVTGALFHTQGGLVIDARARVLRPDGSVLPNLYAAGGAACGVSGNRASGYLSGNGLLTAIALGRTAGQAAAAGRDGTPI